jgi:hypothetical protein
MAQAMLEAWLMRNLGYVLAVALPLVAGCGSHASLQGRADSPYVGKGGEAIVVGAASCWLGGLWSDAVGEKKLAWSDTRTPGIEKRCNDILPGAAMQAIDRRAVDVIAHKLDNETERALLREVAGAARENRDARRAADRVKVDTADDTTTPTERRSDKLAAGAVLRKSDSLRALLNDQGPYAADAHAIGMLLAVDRVQIARGLPMHLKVDVLETALHEVFGVAPPTALPTDEAAPLQRGVWLSYVSGVASAAGHPIPADAPQAVVHREPLAWSGMLKGFADKLRVLEPSVTTTTPLRTVVDAVVGRLDEQYDTQRAVGMSFKKG